MKKSLLVFALTAVPLVPSIALGQELADRKSPLLGAPAIRHKQELRDNRFSLGAGLGSSLAADFYHAVFLNARLAYHITDWLAVSGTGGLNLTPGFKTGFTEKLEPTLPRGAPGARAPEAKDALNGMNKMSQVFGLQAELTPITGKFSLFGKWFAHYDLYFLGGVGFANFTAGKDACDTPMAKETCPDIGMKIGPAVGLGMHTFINKFLALNFEVKNLIVRTNLAGRDETADRLAEDRDKTWTQNYIFALNLNVFLPTVPKITD